MKKQPAYLINTNHHSFRPGIPAKILGVVFMTPEPWEARPCYHIKYKDGEEDYTAIEDVGTYKIVKYSDTIKRKK